MKILSPRGNLLSVERVARVCEKRIDFNGEHRDLFEVAKNSKVNANGLAFKVITEAMGMCIPPEIYIGNLKSEKVEEILNALLMQGYYDFSGMDFQTTKYERKLVIDGGESLPFSSDITPCVMSRRNFTSQFDMLQQGFSSSPYTVFGTPDWSAEAAFCDDEDVEEENNEEE